MSALALKATQLVALASSDRLEEARTAAHIACKYIREHGLRIVDPSERSEPTPTLKPRLVIKSRFEGACPACARRWHVGSQIAWSKERGARCLDCRDAP